MTELLKLFKHEFADMKDEIKEALNALLPITKDPLKQVVNINP